MKPRNDNMDKGDKVDDTQQLTLNGNKESHWRKMWLKPKNMVLAFLLFFQKSFTSCIKTSYGKYRLGLTATGALAHSWCILNEVKALWKQRPGLVKAVQGQLSTRSTHIPCIELHCPNDLSELSSLQRCLLVQSASHSALLLAFAANHVLTFISITNKENTIGHHHVLIMPPKCILLTPSSKCCGYVSKIEFQNKWTFSNIFKLETFIKRKACRPIWATDIWVMFIVDHCVLGIPAPPGLLVSCVWASLLLHSSLSERHEKVIVVVQWRALRGILVSFNGALSAWTVQRGFSCSPAALCTLPSSFLSK